MYNCTCEQKYENDNINAMSIGVEFHEPFLFQLTLYLISNLQGLWWSGKIVIERQRGPAGLAHVRSWGCRSIDAAPVAQPRIRTQSIRTAGRRHVRFHVDVCCRECMPRHGEAGSQTSRRIGRWYTSRGLFYLFIYLCLNSFRRFHRFSVRRNKYLKLSISYNTNNIGLRTEPCGWGFELVN